ncbi:MAG: hypothetical protein ACFCVK_17180 [Acidimicrobiales bacterium]
MTVSENDRLDLRRAFEQALGDQRLAAIAMEAMPPLDYDQLATSGDLRILSAELRGEMAELRGDMAELRGDMMGFKGDVAGEFAKVRTEAVTNLRLLLAGQLATTMMLGAWVVAVT